MAFSSSSLEGELTKEYVQKYRNPFSRTEKIKYYIHDEFTLLDIRSNSWSWPHDDNHEKFIDNVFASIDPYIELDFLKTTSIEDAHIEIYRVSPNSRYVTEIGNLGYATSSDGLRSLGFDVGYKSFGSFQLAFWSEPLTSYSPFINNYDILRYQDAHTIIHEIGHSLGLSHPQLNGKDSPGEKWHTDRETVMSYNENPYYDQYGIFASKPPGWSQADIDKLIDIWGKEGSLSDPSYPVYTAKNTYAQNLLGGALVGAPKLGQNFYGAKFYNLGAGRYGIQQNGKSTIDEITGVSTLQFQDQSISVANDVAAIFDQVTGIRDISGVVFRLYNAAFSRLPDSAGLKNWITGNSSGGQTYGSSAKAFSASQEFKNRYGSTTTDTQYITTLYNNVLGRAPDASGLANYQSLLSSGRDRGALLLDFSESPENYALFTKVTGLS